MLLDSVGRKLGPDAEGRCCFSAPACLSREGWSGSALGPSGDLSAHMSGTRAGLMPRLVSVGTAGQSARAASLRGLGCSSRKRVRRKYLENRRSQGVGGSRVALSDPDSGRGRGPRLSIAEDLGCFKTAAVLSFQNTPDLPRQEAEPQSRLCGSG